MSVGIQVDAPEVELLHQRLLAISRVDFTELLDGLGSLVESQTHKRLRDDKTDPNGTPWKPWSESYAGKKHGLNAGHLPHPGELTSSQGHAILFLDGHLDDSLTHAIAFDEVEIGSNLKYARRQNAARQFMGLSGENNDEAVGVIEDFLDELMRPIR